MKVQTLMRYNFSDPYDVEKNLLVPNCTNEPAID